MGISIWKVPVSLPNDEGEVCLLLQQYEQPTIRAAGQFFLDSGLSTYIHGGICRGTIQFTDITRSKQALCCKRCNLRLTFPTHVRRVSELNDHFNSVYDVHPSITGPEFDEMDVKQLDTP